MTSSQHLRGCFGHQWLARIDFRRNQESKRRVREMYFFWYSHGLEQFTNAQTSVFLAFVTAFWHCNIPVSCLLFWVTFSISIPWMLHALQLWEEEGWDYKGRGCTEPLAWLHGLGCLEKPWDRKAGATKGFWGWNSSYGFSGLLLFQQCHNHVLVSSGFEDYCDLTPVINVLCYN